MPMKQPSKDAAQANSPLISVIFPVRNSAGCLRGALDSVFAQTYQNFEVIAVDGLSTDSTLEVLQSYGEKVKWKSEKDSGTSDAINKGVARANGDLITIILADDFYPDAHVFERVVNVMNAHPSAGALFATMRRVDPDGLAPTVEFPSVTANLHKGTSLHLAGAFFRKSAIQNERLDTSYKITNDHEFACRLIFERRLECVTVPEVNMVMRLGGMSGNPKNDFLKARERFAIRKKYFGMFTALRFGAMDFTVWWLRKMNFRPRVWYRKTKRFLYGRAPA